MRHKDVWFNKNHEQCMSKEYVEKHFPEIKRLRTINADLLEACKIIANWPLKSLCQDGTSATTVMQSLANVRRFARQAITKVERRK